MTSKAAVDNDVLLKLSCYAMLPGLAARLALEGGGLVLGAARYVVRSRIQRGQVPQPEVIVAEFEAFLASVETLEPTADEIALAAALEEIAARHVLELDAGESQLIAVLQLRMLSKVITGDKRAIAATSLLLSAGAPIDGVQGRLVSLEQLVVSLMADYGAAALREAVCAAQGVDRTLTICCACQSQDIGQEQILDGLSSYIGSLRTQSGTVVHPADDPWA